MRQAVTYFISHPMVCICTMLHTIAAILPLLSPPVNADSIPCTDTAVVRGVRSDFLSETGGNRTLLPATSFGVAGVLQDNGIYIKHYGYTGLATFSLRGAEPQQMQVLWNGIAIANPMAGMADLNILGYTGTEELRIYQGGTAAFYGSGNVGGSLLLNTPVSAGNNSGYRFSASTYGNQSHSMNFGLVKKKFTLDNNSLFAGGPNNIPYYTNVLSGDTRKMQHARSERVMQRNSLTYSNSGFQLRTVAEFTSNMRMPGETIAGIAGGTLWDRSGRLFTEAVTKKGKSAFSLRLAAFRDFLRYRDDLTSVDDTSRSVTLNGQAEWVYRLRYFKILAGADVQQIRAKTESYFSEVKRLYPAQLAALFFEKKQWLITANGRYEWFEKIPVFSIFINRSFKGFNVHGSAGTSFRRPALNDLFWARKDNPALVPENGKMAEFGMGWKQKTERVQTEFRLSTFYRELRKPILWTFTGGAWEAVNLYKGVYRGLQGLASGRMQLSGEWVLGGAASAEYVRSAMTWYPGEKVYQRIFIPDITGNITAFCTYRNWKLAANTLYTGQRFSTNDNTEVMPSFALLNASLNYEHFFSKTKYRVVAGIAALNITNTHYQVMPGRPMPIRGFELNLKIQWNQ